MNISKDMTWTSPRTVPIIAYLDWLNRPTAEKRILDSNTKIKWYKTIESIESKRNILGPHTKFNANKSWAANNSDKNMGAKVVVGLGIINISFVNILNKSASIWNAPLRPMIVGPIRRWANANNLRSVKTTNKVKSTTSKDDNKAHS